MVFFFPSIFYNVEIKSKEREWASDIFDVKENNKEQGRERSQILKTCRLKRKGGKKKKVESTGAR